MAKGQPNLQDVIQTLQDAEQNKQLLNDITNTLEKYVNNQEQVLQDLKVLIANTREGKFEGKKGRGGRKPGAGRKKKETAEQQ